MVAKHARWVVDVDWNMHIVRLSDMPFCRFFNYVYNICGKALTCTPTSKCIEEYQTKPTQTWLVSIITGSVRAWPNIKHAWRFRISWVRPRPILCLSNRPGLQKICCVFRRLGLYWCFAKQKVVVYILLQLIVRLPLSSVCLVSICCKIGSFFSNYIVHKFGNGERMDERPSRKYASGQSELAEA